MTDKLLLVVNELGCCNIQSACLLCTLCFRIHPDQNKVILMKMSE